MERANMQWQPLLGPPGPPHYGKLERVRSRRPRIGSKVPEQPGLFLCAAPELREPWVTVAMLAPAAAGCPPPTSPPQQSGGA